MGNEEHGRILSQSVGKWNQWRLEHPWIDPDLSFCVLQGKDLARADLSNCSLYCAWLENASLQDANLSGADVGGASFRGADLSRADLGGVLYLTQMQIDAAHGDEHTVLPQGLRRPEHWLTQATLERR